VVDPALLTAIAGVQSHRVDAGVHQLSVRELHTAVPRIFATLDRPGSASERVSHSLGDP
jgi:ABC-2 type transport system ATP-binding protein